MTTADFFRATMAERRKHARGTSDHDYLTRTARKYVWIMRGIPTKEWTE